jgi:hypothetical protein
MLSLTFICTAIGLVSKGAQTSDVNYFPNEEHGFGLSLLQLRAEHNASAQPESEKMGELKRTRPYYHTSEEIRQETAKLSKDCGDIMTLESRNEGDVSIDTIVKLKKPGSSPVNRVFILFGEHSRELIGPESGLHLLKMFCGKVPVEGGVTIAELLQDNEFQFVLNGNPYSREKVEEGEFCLRTNYNGVDLNRNWDEMWNGAEGGNTNSGPRPFSEAETRIFKNLVEDFKPTTFLTVHSGTRGMYMPWAYDMEHPAKYNAPLMLQILKDIDEKHCKCPYGAAGREVGYSCPGTCLDWVYSKLKTPFVFAWEIYTSHDRDTDLKSRWQRKVEEGDLALLQSGSHLGHGAFAEVFDTHHSDFVARRARDKALAELDSADLGGHTFED